MKTLYCEIVFGMEKPKPSMRRQTTFQSLAYHTRKKILIISQAGGEFDCSRSFRIAAAQWMFV